MAILQSTSIGGKLIVSSSVSSEFVAIRAVNLDATNKVTIRLGHDFDVDRLSIYSDNLSGEVGIGNLGAYNLNFFTNGLTNSKMILRHSDGVLTLSSGGGVELIGSTFGSGYGHQFVEQDTGTRSTTQLLLNVRNNSTSWTKMAEFDANNNTVAWANTVTTFAGTGTFGGGSVFIDNATNPYIRLRKTNATAQIWDIQCDATNFFITDVTAAVTPLRLANATGNATFAGVIGNTGRHDWYFGNANTDAGLRWLFRTNTDAETGGNVGSNWELIARDDSGGSLGAAIKVTRSTLETHFGSNVSIGGDVAIGPPPSAADTRLYVSSSTTGIDNLSYGIKSNINGYGVADGDVAIAGYFSATGARENIGLMVENGSTLIGWATDNGSNALIQVSGSTSFGTETDGNSYFFGRFNSTYPYAHIRAGSKNSGYGVGFKFQPRNSSGALIEGINIDSSANINFFGASGSFVGKVIANTGANPITLGSSDCSAGSWIRDDGANCAIATKNGSMYFGYNGNEAPIYFHAGGTIADASLDEDSNFIAGGNITAYGSPSDARLKDELIKIGNATSKLLKLNGYIFTWNDKGPWTKVGVREAGMIAQEVQSVLPEAIHQNNNGFLDLNYNAVTALLVETVKEQQYQIEELKNQLTEIKNLIKGL